VTTRISHAATAKTIERINGQGRLEATLAAVVEGDPGIAGILDQSDFRPQNVSAELEEKSGPLRYPVVHVYCERLVNDLREKFRTFSGRAHMAIAVRLSHDRLEGLAGAVEAYADAVVRTLDGTRGDWGDGMYYAGGYEVAFGATKRGGRNFLQTATIRLAVEISR
jgi:hypothetical protein